MGTIPKLEDCNPGFYPVEYKVIIAPEEMETVTKGGIILSDRTKETEALAQVRGLLVDVSPLAFNFDQWPEDRAELRPKPGDHVIYGKYLGTLVTGDDGREYRVLHDKDIMGVVKRSNAEPLRAVA